MGMESIIAIVEQDLRYLVRVLVAMLLCAVIGYDRERGGKPAGLRTHTLVGLGASTFVVLGELLLVYFAPIAQDMRYDPIRVLEAVVAGVAFLGAGTIFFSRGENVVRGLTTAASLWATAGVGLAAGLGHYVFAAGVAALIIVVLKVFRLFE